MRDGGKGDKPRPINDREQFEGNWDAIFNKHTTPTVVVDSGASYIEPIPFAGLVDVDEELRRLRAENEELRSSGKNASNH